MVKQFRSMTYPYVAWISVMIVLPMLLIVLYAFTVSGNEVLTFQFTFDNFKRFVTDTVFMEVLGRSLYIAAQASLRADCEFRDFYDRLRSRGYSHRYAVCAVARKMLCVVWALMRSGEEYSRERLSARGETPEGASPVEAV